MCSVSGRANRSSPIRARCGPPAQFLTFLGGAFIAPRSASATKKTGQKQAGSARTTKVLAGLKGGCSWPTIYGPPRLLKRERGPGETYSDVI